MNKPHRFRITAACIALLCGLFALLILRVPYGFDWTDEAYYTALPYRFVLGDRALIDTWEVHQFSGLLALPFLKAYLMCSGGDMTGVMLYFRYVLICAQFALAVYAYFVLRRRVKDLPAALIAGLMLMHVHYGLNGFSYNAISPLLCMASAIAAFDALDGAHAPWKAALSGMFYACSVQAYPYFALSLPIYVVFWVVQDRCARGKKSGALRGISRWFYMGVLAVILLFVWTLLAGGGPAALARGVRGMLGDPDHVGESVVLVLLQYGNAIRVLFGPVIIGAVALMIWSVASCCRKEISARLWMRRAGFAACAALLFCAVVWVLFYDYPNPHKINLAAMIPVLLAPSIYFLSGRKCDESMLLIFLGAALSIAVQLGSNTRIRSSSGMLLPASVGTLVYLFQTMGGAFPNGVPPRFLRRATVCACACTLLLTAGLRMATVYRDAPLTQLDTAIASGPAQGIVTTAENAANYDAVYDDLTRHAPKRGYLLVTNLLPAAYLMTQLAPATPSTFNMTVDAPWLARYYAENPERVPDCVYAVNADIGVGNEWSLSGTDALCAALGADYEMERLSGGTMFTRIAP